MKKELIHFDEYKYNQFVENVNTLKEQLNTSIKTLCESLRMLLIESDLQLVRQQLNKGNEALELLTKRLKTRIASTQKIEIPGIKLLPEKLAELIELDFSKGELNTVLDLCSEINLHQSEYVNISFINGSFEVNEKQMNVFKESCRYYAQTDEDKEIFNQINQLCASLTQAKYLVLSPNNINAIEDLLSVKYNSRTKEFEPFLNYLKNPDSLMKLRIRN